MPILKLHVPDLNKESCYECKLSYYEEGDDFRMCALFGRPIHKAVDMCKEVRDNEYIQTDIDES